ncbi:MAG: DUF3923 family protein [Streptococcus sp.]
MVKKRFFIGFNGILLALFLDICLLISIRTVDHPLAIFNQQQINGKLCFIF